MKNFLTVLIFAAVLIYQSSADRRQEFCDSVSRPINCLRSKYSPLNNICNNLKNPYFGAANTKLGRFMKSRYADGISEPPKSVTGAELPSARRISLEVFNDKNVLNLKYSQAFMQFGQLYAHDVSNVLQFPSQRGCCTEDGQIVSDPDPNCLYMPVPENDVIHKGMKCLDFTRSITDIDMKCPNYPKGPAEQLNSATARTDLSFVYGTSEEALKRQRSFKNGQLAIEWRNNSTWPPHEPDTKNVCFSKNPLETCYMSGDSKINQHPGLSIIHILFVREHNRIANELQKLNPHWSEEILFQETRRINIATFQSISYYEWFVAIAGVENVKPLGFPYQPSGDEYADDYDETLDPAVKSEFVAGVFRLLHTVIDGHYRMLSESGSLEGIVRTSDFYHRPKIIEEYGNFDSLMRGLLFQPGQFFDKNYDPEIRSYLFRMDQKYGNDLKAIDIQRGRDHGLASYNDLRSFCGLSRAEKWEDFADHIPMTDIENLRKVYAHVDDVDLNVGSSLEKPFRTDFLIGITYTCLLRMQVKIFRTADRFWFENNDPVAKFTPNQVAELRNARLTRVICDNTESILTVPMYPFFMIGYNNNSYIKCSDLPKVDLSVFKE